MRGCEAQGPGGYLCTKVEGHAGLHEAWGCVKGQCEPPWDDRSDTKDSDHGNYTVGLPTDDKARKRLQLWTFMFNYFPDAWLAVVNVAVAGNEQHNPGQPLHWAREKSTDQMNTAFRHQWDYGRGVKKDTDDQYHLAKAIWRLMAQLQLDIEEDRRKNGDK